MCLAADKQPRPVPVLDIARAYKSNAITIAMSLRPVTHPIKRGSETVTVSPFAR
jgi:hypothetical protein